MAEAETKSAHTPDWAEVGPELLAACKAANVLLSLLGAAPESSDVVSKLRAAISRAEA